MDGDSNPPVADTAEKKRSKKKRRKIRKAERQQLAKDETVVS